MSWQQIARSRRRDWERKRALKAGTALRWFEAFRGVPVGAVAGLLGLGHMLRPMQQREEEVFAERARQDGLPTRGLEAYWSLGPELQRGDSREREFGELMRMALGERADQPEGPPYVHTYTMPPTEYPDLEETLNLWKRLWRWILNSRLVGE